MPPSGSASSASGPAATHEWSTRHSVLTLARRTVALLNALSPEPPEPEAVAAVLLEYGEPGPVRLTEADVADLRAAAEELRAVFEATDVDLAASRLNRLLARGTGSLRLSSHHGESPWHPHLDSDDEAPWGEWLLASSCLALTVLLWDRQEPPGGVCASPSCRHVFITRGSGPDRRYCSRRCATRERVAAHRRRAAGGGGG
ncbi:CGNR zinc finger domain-containing protein [Streptomyces triticagri]|uniref:CGNR zinc finger domain-containing protein n=1 Tax=Streptomyces triticagri TaxID=2293568 RepID=A0A372MCJ6_9ACTN|nr:CGNR zinc finger domain-containing protein [Streptomyces triticagri]RFU88592.1 CGNR zinc finger domain-containing protein [Streptomyces triticagri]RFU88658.1 CGNR zinc finger domain-containing protein [Streptomyces triticagri]